MNSLSQHLLWAVVLPFLVAISVVTQARSQGATKDDAQSGFTWTEAYEGSGNADGFITDLNSTVGYTFGKHFVIDAGAPYLFLEPSTSKTGATSAYGSGSSPKPSELVLANRRGRISSRGETWLLGGAPGDLMTQLLQRLSADMNVIFSTLASPQSPAPATHEPGLEAGPLTLARAELERFSARLGR